MAGRAMNGSGTIKKVGTGPNTRWRCTVMIGTDPKTGKSIRRSATFKTQAELKKWRQEVLKAKEGNNPISDNARLRLDDFLQQWLKHQHTNIKESTYERYAFFVKDVSKDIGHLKVQKLGRAHIQNYIDSLKEHYSYGSVRKVYATLKVAFKYAILMGILQVNPCEGIQLGKKPKDEIEIFSEEQFAVFKRAIVGNRFEDIFRISFLGLRRGEALGLQIEDVDFENKLLHIRHEYMQLRGGGRLIDGTKTDASRRDIPLSESTLTMLKKRIGDRSKGFVFVWETGKNIGKPISPQCLVNEFKKILKENDLPDIRYHDLRHQAASRMITQGVDPKTAAAILGHSSPMITLAIYAHTHEAAKQNAVDILTET